jgi:hypothetical protein
MISKKNKYLFKSTDHICGLPHAGSSFFIIIGSYEANDLVIIPKKTSLSTNPNRLHTNKY